MSVNEYRNDDSRESRFRPANSNDAARASLLHHFTDVPECCFGRDDGISAYLRSDSGIDVYPLTPARHVALHADVPEILKDKPEPVTRLARRLLRSGFALSVVLHAFAALAVGCITMTLPDAEMLMEGETVIAVVVEGQSDANLQAEGAEEELQEQVEDHAVLQQLEPIRMPEPVVLPLPVVKPVEIKQSIEANPVPETLVARDTAERQIEPIARLLPTEEKSEKKPDPEPALKKEKPKTSIEKKTNKPAKARKSRKGNKGDAAINAKKGETDAREKGDATRDNSRGDSVRTEKGNAARSSYKGLVQKKLQRAKSRVRVAAKGSVTVAFTISADGGLSALRVARSSGKVALDRAALEIVRKAAPFPQIPAETGKKSWSMTVPISFK